MAGGNPMDGARMMYGNQPGAPKPTPFTPPKRRSRTLNPDQVPVDAAEDGPTG